MRNIPIWIQWTISASVAAVAFRIGGMLEGLPYMGYGDGTLGVRNWLLATMLAGTVGTLFAPVAFRRTARSIFIGVPICVSTLILAYHFFQDAQEAMAVSSVAHSIVGGLVAWLFLSKIIRTI